MMYSSANDTVWQVILAFSQQDAKWNFWTDQQIMTVYRSQFTFVSVIIIIVIIFL